MLMPLASILLPIHSSRALSEARNCDQRILLALQPLGKFQRQNPGFRCVIKPQVSCQSKYTATISNSWTSMAPHADFWLKDATGGVRAIFEGELTIDAPTLSLRLQLISKDDDTNTN